MQIMSAACCAFNSDWLFIAVSVDFPPRQKDDLEAATLQCQRLSAASLWIQEGQQCFSLLPHLRFPEADLVVLGFLDLQSFGILLKVPRSHHVMTATSKASTVRTQALGKEGQQAPRLLTKY